MNQNITKAILPLAALSCVHGKMLAQDVARPNILYIMCDDHAMQAISAYGSPISKLAPTPNIDRLAQRGMLFRNCFVENSLSTPSRACLMTGLYSHQNGQRQLAEGIDTTNTFVPELMQKAGYETGVVGKWHMMCRPKGFDYYYILDGQGKYYNPNFCTTGNYGKYKQEMGYATTLTTKHAIEFLDNRQKDKPFCLYVHHKAPHRSWFAEPKHIGMYDGVDFPLPKTFWDNYENRGSAAKTQKMNIEKDMELILDFKIPELLDTSDVESMASYAGLMGELGRMTAAQRMAWDKYYMPRNRRFIEAKLSGKDLAVWKYQNYIRDYMSVIASVDESVGQLMDYLKAHDLDKNTVVIYTSDQGFYMGEHGWFDKRFMYEESLHTPLIISYPGHIKEGVENTDMVQNIDFAPTFLAYAGVQQPKEMTGKPLQPLLAGNKPKNWRKDLYYHYYDYPTYHLVRKHDGVRNDRYKLIYFYGKGGMRAVEENKYQKIPGTSEYNCLKYLNATHYFNDDADVSYYELYDLQNDPDELNNIYGKKGTEKVTKQLMKRLNDYRKELKIDEY